MIKHSAWLLIIWSFLGFTLAQANETFQPFNIGSYQKILHKRAGNDLLVVFWSIDCPPCIKELKDLDELHQDNPQYQLTLINTDIAEDKSVLIKVLQEHNLSKLDNWIFSDKNEQKLRYEVDPRWYGDLPRSYFFSTTGKHKRLRGALNREKLDQLFNPQEAI